MNKDTSLFKLQSYDFDKEIKISSGDWLHDFYSKFQNTNYQIFELPIPKNPKGKSGLANRINEVIQSIKEMENAKNEGDWNKVVKESRPIWELIRNKNEINELLKKDEINEQTIASYNKLIESLYDFASKFIHKETKANEIMAINKAGKEDAELIYALSVSIANLISQKINK